MKELLLVTRRMVMVNRSLPWGTLMMEIGSVTDNVGRVRNTFLMALILREHSMMGKKLVVESFYFRMVLST